MEIIDEKDYKNADKLEEKKLVSKPKLPSDWIDMGNEEFSKLLKQMNNPLEVQKELAVKIKSYLDRRIEFELENLGMLSRDTREWVKEFNGMLEGMNKAIFGDKKVNVNLNISHSQIASHIRKNKENVVDAEVKEEKESD